MTLKTKKITKGEREKILNRVARIEGQVKAIHRMIEEEKECIDIITQVSAIRAAISTLGVELLKNDLMCKQAGKHKIDETYLKTLFKIS